MACSHRRRGRDKTVVVCSCVHTANSIRQDSFVSSPIVFTLPMRLCGLIETGSRPGNTVLSRHDQAIIVKGPMAFNHHCRQVSDKIDVIEFGLNEPYLIADTFGDCLVCIRTRAT